MLNGKMLSILGDSISTYQGVSNDASVNSSLYYNPAYYSNRFPLEKTYWMHIINRFGFKLCVNNSWSGGNLSGKDDLSSGMNRASNLSRDSGEKPDFVIVFMGLNDLGRGVSVDVFSLDYQATLMIIKKSFPLATVCCVNLPDRDIFLKKRAMLFNQAIEKAVKAAGDNFFIADLYNSRLNNDFYYMNTLDGLHPDEDGMRIIADVIENAIKRNL